MALSARLAFGLVCLAGIPAGWAQAPAGPARPAVPAAPASAPAASAFERRVIEDDGVRIEEQRARGQLKSVTVQSKLGHVRPYEIVVGRGGRDPSQDKSAAGQSTWSILKF
jgi:hypothetical protein